MIFFPSLLENIIISSIQTLDQSNLSKWDEFAAVITRPKAVGAILWFDYTLLGALLARLWLIQCPLMISDAVLALCDCAMITLLLCWVMNPPWPLHRPPSIAHVFLSTLICGRHHSFASLFVWLLALRTSCEGMVREREMRAPSCSSPHVSYLLCVRGKSAIRSTHGRRLSHCGTLLDFHFSAVWGVVHECLEEESKIKSINFHWLKLSRNNKIDDSPNNQTRQDINQEIILHRRRRSIEVPRIRKNN